MKRREHEHGEAIKLRLKGWSYSQIKDKLGLSKSTLSGWLDAYPLSAERIRELRDRNPQRIERFRETMHRKRVQKEEKQYAKIKDDLALLSRRELFLGGFFLYWGEGTKTARGSITVSNTDPSVLRYTIRWFKLLGVSEKEIHILMHLYKDMNEKRELSFWAKELRISSKCFHKPYIKDSKLSSITYKNGFGHGTCHVRVYNQELYDYVMMGLKYIREKYAIV